MEIKSGYVVISKAGRDKGKALLAVGNDGKYVFVADGRERPLERPKRKNPKHLSPTSISLSESDKAGNHALKKALIRYSKTFEIREV